ncbi:MAG: DNA alkylation repair protein [Saprospiraceae bacterium]|nr:DNA alkylation repair protein [Saprospiraceae bacterium]
MKQFVLDPNPIIPVLELMMEDDSEYVRKSVANNLNDISKDHPEVVINLIKKWKDASKKYKLDPETRRKNAVEKWSSRSLIFIRYIDRNTLYYPRVCFR